MLIIEPKSIYSLLEKLSDSRTNYWKRKILYLERTANQEGSRLLPIKTILTRQKFKCFSFLGKGGFRKDQ
jgi:hypothetical protein